MTKQEIKEQIDGLKQKRHILDVQITEIDNQIEDLENTYENMREFQEAL